MSDLEETTRKNLSLRNAFKIEGRILRVAILIRKEDQRPLDAPWWHKKEATVIGVDIDGNFFLRHCDGSVMYWEHKFQSATVIAPSVNEFLIKLTDVN